MTITMIKKRQRLLYLLVCIATVIAGLVFLKTLVTATMYVPDSGSYGAIYVASPTRAHELDGNIPDMIGTSTDMASSTDMSTSTKAASPKAAVRWIPAKSASIPSDYPVRLSIPSLKIDAAVQYLGVNSKGNLGVPNNFTDVGWYAAGTIPGDVGSAVMDGHVDNGLALAGVFKHLSSIAVGDDISVALHDGRTIHFAVTSIRSFGYKDAPVDMIFNERDGRLLKLITCGGTWVPGDRTYDERIVVTAALVP